MERTVRATVTYRTTATYEYTYEELGFEENENPTLAELRQAISDYTEQVGCGIDAYVDCEKVEFENETEE